MSQNISSKHFFKITKMVCWPPQSKINIVIAPSKSIIAKPYEVVWLLLSCPHRMVQLLLMKNIKQVTLKINHFCNIDDTKNKPSNFANIFWCFSWLGRYFSRSNKMQSTESNSKLVLNNVGWWSRPGYYVEWDTPHPDNQDGGSLVPSQTLFHLVLFQHSRV